MNTANPVSCAPPRRAGSPPAGCIDGIALRRASLRDLGAISGVIEAAMTTWGLSERVRRLSLPLYQYNATDLDHLDVVVAETADGAVVGVTAVETAAPADCPASGKTALLHGIYVDPAYHGAGIGSRLLAYAQGCAVSTRHAGLMVRANPAATGFFDAMGFQRLPVQNPDADYPYRYYTSLQPGADTVPGERE